MSKAALTAVITGAAGEIGFAIAERLADAGYRLVLSDLDLPRLDALAAQLPADSVLATQRHDVASMDDARALAKTCATTRTGIDCVVCSAGLYEDLPIEEIGPEAWRRSMAVNLDGTFYTVQALRPYLSEESSVVNIASVAGHRGSVDHTPYAAAKGGVLTLTRSLAQELAPKTRVNAVSPGLIDTRMIKALDADRLKTMVAAMPLQRLGTAAEVADVVVFLAGPAAGYITGETIHVNGGHYLHS
ncbi:MAG: SDR family oxidoreductase [Gammaproteobacteria bacterium]|nr:SDR family oxidoreductase [Gammaproteobacteria bacterium]